MKMLTPHDRRLWRLSLAFLARRFRRRHGPTWPRKYKTGDKATYKFDLTRNEKTVIASTTSPLSRVHDPRARPST